MGKKSEKPAVEPVKARTKAKPSAKAVSAAPVPVAPSKTVVSKKPVAKAKPVVAKPATVVSAKPAPKARPAAKKVAAPTFEEIQKQAYFVAERRMAEGLPGDSASDWIQAEKELLALAK